MTMLQLPQEIKADFLRQGSLALVSKAFRPQVQRMRFRELTLHNVRASERTERLSDILVLNPTLGEHVQTVCFAWYTKDSKINLQSKRGQTKSILYPATRLPTCLSAAESTWGV
jgi:hypothetical protein